MLRLQWQLAGCTSSIPSLLSGFLPPLRALHPPLALCTQLPELTKVVLCCRHPQHRGETSILLRAGTGSVPAFLDCLGRSSTYDTGELRASGIPCGLEPATPPFSSSTGEACNTAFTALFNQKTGGCSMCWAVAKTTDNACELCTSNSCQHAQTVLVSACQVALVSYRCRLCSNNSVRTHTHVCCMTSPACRCPVVLTFPADCSATTRP